MSFRNEERGNITLWILYIASAVLVTVVWIIIYQIIDVHIFPIAAASGADTSRPYIYFVIFLKWFPLMAIFGYSIYAIINSQKPEPPGGF